METIPARFVESSHNKRSISHMTSGVSSPIIGLTTAIASTPQHSHQALLPAAN
jgi:hypothetical protein